MVEVGGGLVVDLGEGLVLPLFVVEHVLVLHEEEGEVLRVLRHTPLHLNNMSRAYYYCRNFTFAEVNNLYAFGRRDPGSLTSRQRIIRLYRAMLRKQIALNIHSVHNFNIHKFAEDSRRIRDDFDKLWNGVSPKEEEVMMEKYFLYIEKHFDPYMPMRRTPPSSHRRLAQALQPLGQDPRVRQLPAPARPLRILLATELSPQAQIIRLH